MCKLADVEIGLDQRCPDSVMMVTVSVKAVELELRLIVDGSVPFEVRMTLCKADRQLNL